MVQLALGALMCAGFVPLMLAWLDKRGTSLSHAIAWSIVAWIAWGVAFLFTERDQAGLEPARYCALCLTACAGIAVLGARRPHVAAWDFVVIGLFAVMSWPLLETLLIGTHPVDVTRIFFMAATLAVGIFNYLPTRLAPAAVVLLFVCGGQIMLLYAPYGAQVTGAAFWLDLTLTFVPWIGWICLCRSDAGREAITRRWISFRDCWGFFWSQRVRDQFNRAAANADLPITLSWTGVRGEKRRPVEAQAEIRKSEHLLSAILQRFEATG